MGTPRKRPNGTYQAMVRVVGHPHLYETFKTMKEAKAWQRQKETEIADATITNPKIMIDELIDTYVREIAPKRKMADSHLKHDIPSIKRKFAGMRMSDLTGRGLVAWCTRQGTAPSTQNWHIARLRGVLRQCEHHYDIVVPWKDIDAAQKRMMTMGTLKLANERDRRCSRQELDRIKAQLRVTAVHNWKDIFDFSIASCMRVAEVTRIRWEDFNEAERTVIIRDRKHPTKKFGNDCVVPLINGAFEIVMRQRSVVRKWRSGEKVGRIFPFCKLYASKLFHAATIRAKVHDMTLHDLRHEGISRLFELGFKIEEVAMVSGHTDWAVLRRYTHLKPQSLVDRERQLRAFQEQFAA